MDKPPREELQQELLALENAIDRRPLTVSINAPAAEAIAVMGKAWSSCPVPSLALPLESLWLREARASCVLIVEGANAAGVGTAVTPLGIFTQGDAVRAILSNLNLQQAKVRDIVSRPLVKLDYIPGQDIFTALAAFQTHKIFHLPVVNQQQQLIGTITPASIRKVIQPAKLLKGEQVTDCAIAPVIQTNDTNPVIRVVELMRAYSVRYVLICASDQTSILGYVSPQEIVQLYTLGIPLNQVKAGDIANPALCLLQPTDPVLAAYGQLQQHRGIGGILAADGSISGLVTLPSILQHLARSHSTPDPAASTAAEAPAPSSQDTTPPPSVRQLSPADSQAVLEKDRLLGGMALRIRRSLNLAEILKTIVGEVRHFLKADRVSIYRFNPDWSGVIVEESVRENWLPILGRYCEDTYFSAKFIDLYRQGRVQTAADIYTSDLTQCHIDLLAQFQVRAILVVPILGGDDLWGLIAAHQCSGPRQWKDFEIDLLEQLATHISISIQQSELYHQLERELSERQRVEDRIAASLKEKEVLLKEIHHRVKNNLQIVSSLLRLQSGYIKDEEALGMFRDSQNRIRSMALVHEKLYKSEDLSKVDFAEYVQSLTAHLVRSYGQKGSGITLQVNIKNIFLDIDTAIPCGLLINELVSNALQHAFYQQQYEGHIVIDLRRTENEQLCLTVSDNGRGFPREIDFRSTESLGLQLVCSLTEQLAGSIKLEQDGGTVFTINFPQSIA